MMTNEADVIQAIKKYAEKHGLDPRLVYSFCKVESALNPMAIRYEPGWKYHYSATLFSKDSGYTYDTERILQACSIGIMQVMGTVARELGFKGSLLKLTDLETGLEYGCLKLRSLKGKYSSLGDVVASYNAGSPVKINGKYFNDDYVKKIKAVYENCKI